MQFEHLEPHLHTIIAFYCFVQGLNNLSTRKISTYNNQLYFKKWHQRSLDNGSSVFSTFFKIKIFFCLLVCEVCVRVSVWMNVYHTRAGTRKKTGEGIRSWVGVDGCEGLAEVLRANHHRRRREAMLLTSEPYFKSLTFQHKPFGLAMECFYS